MPRILPRILQKLKEHQNKPQNQLIAPKVAYIGSRRKSLHRPPPPPPSFSAIGRKKSILLDPVNPIIHPGRYVRHKSLPPRVLVESTGRRPKNTEYDRPREMTPLERNWWSSPYLRMLSSCIRKCFMTSRHLPSDFLIRLASFRIPTPRIAQQAEILLPDGLQHPRFRTRRVGFGHYIVCWKKAFQQLAERGNYKRISPNISMHPRLEDYISHLLRLRVLQDLEMLADQLRIRPQDAPNTTVLRRLTRAEFRSIRETGTISYKGAVAVLVVPPPNRDPTTKKRPEPASTSEPIVEESNSTPLRPAPPLSLLYASDAPEYDTIYEDLPDLIPGAQVPLYNGITLFPSRRQRAALHAHLSQVLLVERKARYRHIGKPDSTQEPVENRAKGDQKASHAFLLCSDADTVKRGDAAAVAIALWRVRMWEGAGWGDEKKGWVLSTQ